MTGYITGGESTWVHLGDRPQTEFMAVVEACLALCQSYNHLRDPEVDVLRKHARQLKGDQDYTDEDIVTELIRAAVTPGDID